MRPYHVAMVETENGEVLPPDGCYLAFAEVGRGGQVWYLIWAPYSDGSEDVTHRAAKAALHALRGLDGTTFQFPEPRAIINRAKAYLEGAVEP